jgi:hypothetical protein
MLWSEIKKWAKQQGYETLKEKGDEEIGEPVKYYWSKIDDASHSGVAKSVSKLAKEIYNDITDNRWLDHQQEYNNISMQPDIRTQE